MNKKERKILEGAVAKAIDNGYEPEHDLKHWEKIIFSHSFARAFFGSDLITVGPAGTVFRDKAVAWGYHLQMLIIAENRFNYLKKFL